MINKNRLIDNFMNLVRIDSPTGEELEITDYLLSLLTENGLVDSAQKDAFGNIYARLEGGGESIFFTDHLDTVEPGRGVEPIIRGGYITASGDTILGADDKSSVASLIEMLWVFKETDIPHRPLEFIFTISEEVGNLGAINFDYSLLTAKKGYCFDCSWPLGTLVTASPFYERFTVNLEGKTAHASRPDLGHSTLPVLADILSTLKLGIIDSETIANIGVLKGGFVRNAIPGEMRIEGEIRSFREEKIIKTAHDIRQKIAYISETHNIKYAFEFVRENPGYKLDPKELETQIAELNPVMNKLKIPLNPVEIWSVSDTNIFAGKGLSCMNLGSGREFAHTKKERIKIKTLEMLTQVIIELAGI